MKPPLKDATLVLTISIILLLVMVYILLLISFILKLLALHSSLFIGLMRDIYKLCMFVYFLLFLFYPVLS